MFPAPPTKIENVGVAFDPMVVTTLGCTGEMQAAVRGSVSHIETLRGKLASPVSTEAVTRPATPTFAVATEKAPVPVAPGILMIPSPESVAAIAIMSGTGVSDADSNRVLTPATVGAAAVLVQLNCSSTTVGAKAAVGVKAIIKLWNASGAIVAGVFGVPITVLVSGSVV